MVYAIVLACMLGLLLLAFFAFAIGGPGAYGRGLHPLAAFTFGAIWFMCAAGLLAVGATGQPFFHESEAWLYWTCAGVAIVVFGFLTCCGLAEYGH